MYLLQSSDIHCPYCGETISVVLDASVESQQYIEDCQVCCRPITMRVETAADGSCTVSVAHEDET